MQRGVARGQPGGLGTRERTLGWSRSKQNRAEKKKRDSKDGAHLGGRRKKIGEERINGDANDREGNTKKKEDSGSIFRKKPQTFTGKSKGQAVSSNIKSKGPA